MNVLQFDCSVKIIIAEILVAEYKRKWRELDLFGRKAFVDKWARLRKAPDGHYRTVIILGKKNGSFLVDCDRQGIINVDENDIYAWDKRFVDKRWRKM